MPEPLTEKHRGVDPGGQHGRGGQLGGIVAAGKGVRIDLQVHLKAGVTALDHDGVQLHEQLVDTRDLQLKGTAAQAGDGFVEPGVARPGRHVVERQVREMNGGQDATQGNVVAQVARQLPYMGQPLQELSFQASQTVAFQKHRLQVDLQVEARQFGYQMRIPVARQHLLSHRRRVATGLHQKQLLLRSKPADAPLNQPILQHPRKRRKVLQQLQSKRREGLCFIRSRGHILRVR